MGNWNCAGKFQTSNFKDKWQLSLWLVLPFIWQPEMTKKEDMTLLPSFNQCSPHQLEGKLGTWGGDLKERNH